MLCKFSSSSEFSILQMPASMICIQKDVSYLEINSTFWTELRFGLNFSTKIGMASEIEIVSKCAADMRLFFGLIYFF